MANQISIQNSRKKWWVALTDLSNVLLHVGTNDVMRNIISDQIVDDLLQLKHEIELELPHCNVIISTPVVRADNNKWNTILRNVTEKLKRLNIKLMENSNIETNQLGKKGIHLNKWGNSKMGMNIISLIQRL